MIAKHIKCILICLFILTIVFKVGLAQEESAHINQVNLYKDYYLFLKLIKDDSLYSKISKLKKYLENHPAFERVYIQLLQQMLQSGQIKEAKIYFKKLVQIDKYRKNSLWMMAKIFAIQDSPRAAFLNYREVLDHDHYEYSQYFLKDFVDFDHQNQNKYDVINLLNRKNIDSLKFNIAQAIYYCRKFNLKKTIDVLNKYPDAIPSNLIALYILGFSYLNINDFTNAESYWLQALELSRSNNDLQSESNFLINLGELMKLKHNYKKAIEYTNMGFSIAKSIDDLLFILYAEGYLASIYLEQGKFHEALNTYQIAIRKALLIGEYNKAAHYYWGKAIALKGLGDLCNALTEYDRSKKLATRTNDVYLLFNLFLDKGKLFSDYNLDSFATEEYLRAYDFAKNTDFIPYICQSSTRIADLLLENNKYSKARDLFSMSLEQCGDNERLVEKAYWIWMIAECYFYESRYDMAQQFFQRAFETVDIIKENSYAQYVQAYARLRFADIELKKNNFAKALRIYNEDLITRVAETEEDLKLERLSNLGDLYRHKKKLAKAIEYYSKAIDIIEDKREELKVEQFRIGYFSQKIIIYQNLVNCMFKQKKFDKDHIEKICHLMLLSRGRTLQDYNLKNRNILSDNKYQSYAEQLRIIQRKLREYSWKNYSDDHYKKLISQLRIKRHLLLQQRLQLIDQEIVQQNINQTSILPFQRLLEYSNEINTGIIIYHITPEASFALVVYSNKANLVELEITPSKLVDLKNGLLKPFFNVCLDSMKKIPYNSYIAYQLYKILLAPIEKKVVLPQDILIIPDMSFVNLPFEMLLDQPADQKKYLPTDYPDYNNNFLLNRYTFTYSPALTFLNKQTYEQGNQDILIVSNPIFHQNGISLAQNQLRSPLGPVFFQLPYTDLEAEQIKNIYPSVTHLSRENAIKKNLLKELAHKKVLHIATHGFVDSTFDAFSGLVLSTTDDSTDDGYLMGYEIADLDYNYDLITLSACETGLGKLMPGEGVLSLPRLFLKGGAKSVLMTNWKIYDKFSAELMPIFYNEYLNKGLSKAKALSTAKLEMLKKKPENNGIYYHHPFFWASFTLYGDPGLRSNSSYSMSLITILFIIFLILGLMISIYFRYSKINKSFQ